MFKFVLLTVVFDFLYSIVAGILYGFINPPGSVSPDTATVTAGLLGVIVVWPAIVTAARVCFKNKPIGKAYISKTSSSLLTVFIIVTLVFRFFAGGEGLHQSTLMIIDLYSIVHIILAYILSRVYLKKYSI